MVFLTFRIDNNWYALPSSEVVEVLPVVHFRQIPHTPGWMAGVMIYRQQQIPVIDLTQLLTAQESADRPSTRLVIVHYRQENDANLLVGLIAEHATETIKLTHDQFRDPVIATQATPYLGRVSLGSDKDIQIINSCELFSDEVKKLLYPKQEEGQGEVD